MPKMYREGAEVFADKGQVDIMLAAGFSLEDTEVVPAPEVASEPEVDTPAPAVKGKSAKAGTAKKKL